jgi:hypothetical protein
VLRPADPGVSSFDGWAGRTGLFGLLAVFGLLFVTSTVRVGRTGLSGDAFACAAGVGAGAAVVGAVDGVVDVGATVVTVVVVVGAWLLPAVVVLTVTGALGEASFVSPTLIRSTTGSPSSLAWAVVSTPTPRPTMAPPAAATFQGVGLRFMFAPC